MSFVFNERGSELIHDEGDGIVLCLSYLLMIGTTKLFIGLQLILQTRPMKIVLKPAESFDGFIFDYRGRQLLRSQRERRPNHYQGILKYFSYTQLLGT